MKQHLETSPSSLDIPEYHVKKNSANLSMGKIVVTYLNLDAFQGQLIDASKSLHTSATQDASLLLRAGLPQGTVASSLARVLLKNRKIPNFDVGRDLEKAAGFTRVAKVQTQHANSFLSYAQEHWFSHTMFLFESGDQRLLGLLARLIDGDLRVVELPWTLEDARTFSPHFLDSISVHQTLLYYVVEGLRKQGKEGVYGMKKLLMRFLYGFHNSEGLIDAIAEDNLAAIELMLDNTSSKTLPIHPTLLHIASIWGNFEIVRTLLKHGADVKAADLYFGNVMLTAAVSSIGKQVIPLLLERGAEEIPIDESYSDEVKEVLQNSYYLHRRTLPFR